MVKITSDVNSVLNCIDDSISIIGLGESHNSRSAIHFMIDYFHFLRPRDPNRQTYLLSAFLPPDIYFKRNPNSRMQSLDCYVNSSHFRHHRECFKKNMVTREISRSKESTPYTVLGLYRFLYLQGVIIQSVETVSDNNPKDVEIYRRMSKGDLSSIELRISNLNWNVVSMARSILKKDKNARIIIYAGMAFTNDTTFVKFDKQGDYIEELSFSGSCSQLSRDFSVCNIVTHEMGLCCDPEFFMGVDANASCFSRYSPGNNMINIDKADYLLFTPSVSTCTTELRQCYDSIFFPGEERDIKMLSDNEQRKVSLSGLLKEYRMKNSNQCELINGSTKKRKRKKKRSPESSSTQAPASAFFRDSSDGGDDGLTKIHTGFNAQSMIRQKP